MMRSAVGPTMQQQHNPIFSRPPPSLLLFPLHRPSRFSVHPQSKSPNSSYSRLHRRRGRRHPFFVTAAAPIIVKNTSKQEQEEERVHGDDNDEEVQEHFTEVGYISKVHGLQGELRVKPNTGFPQLRFSEPGKRWLRTQVAGKEMISEVELTGGRDHPGQKSWIISLRGIDSVDQAKQLVGSILLVKEEDRPDLEEGEFYTSDLVGMRVVLKDSGRLVGVVANVFNYGANDLLHVMLELTKEESDPSNPSMPARGSSGQMAWVPFVEAIVPEVDLERREMRITPPKGLLEFYIRNDMRSKKERRQLEWKERKKLQHRLTAAKRKLSEMQQNHLLEYLKTGVKTQKQLLIKEIVNINFKLFQHALQSISMPLDRFNLSEFMDANSAISQKNSFSVSSKLLSCCASKEELHYDLHKEGLQLLLESRVAIVFISKDDMNVPKDSEMDTISISTNETKLLHFQELILAYDRLLKVEGQGLSIPLIVVAPAQEIRSYEELLLDSGHLGIDSQKVWILEDEKLPIVSLSSDCQKILSKSSYEILQAPVGSGGIFSLLSSHGITDKLTEMHVEYVQVCCLGGRSKTSIVGSSVLLLGSVKRQGAEMGVSVPQGELEDEDEFNMVFSTKHLNKICKQIDKLRFVPVPERHAHVELVKDGGEYVEKIHPIPEEPNSYRLHSSVYSALNSCSLDSICIMHVTTE